MDPEKGKKLLEELIERGRALLEVRPLTSDKYDQWGTIAANYLEQVFGKSHPNVFRVTMVPMDRNTTWEGYSLGEEVIENNRAKKLTTQITQLEALVEVLATELQLHDDAPTAKDKATRPAGRKIFLVHGHDKEAMLEVKQLLTELDLDVTILHEQPNEGRTIIEKFEDHADVDFAVALLTPDDMGGLANASDEPQQPRPRQNVIFEMGYFFGLLGRSRVCALYKEGVEPPSDYSGILYVKMDDDGGWRLELAKELRTADFAIDMNKLIR